MKKSKIEWTDQTWNPLRGCTRVSEGCRNCYAEQMAARFCGEGMPYEGLIDNKRWNGQIKLVHDKLIEPLRWTRPRMVFVNSMSDLFHESVPFEFIDQVFAVMESAQQHTFQVLTKRADRMLQYFQGGAGGSRRMGKARMSVKKIHDNWNPSVHRFWPLSNVWLGVTVEDQKAADERIPLLLQTPAAVRWISVEPMVGPIRLNLATKCDQQCSEHQDAFCPGTNGKCVMQREIDWVVCGGESGKNARPMHPAWARSLRDQCKAAGVPFLFKQWGEFAPNWLNDDSGQKIDGSEWIDKMGKKAAGRLLDGVLHDEYPIAIEGTA